MDNKVDKWEESYARKENFIYSAKEEVIKFLNRFVKKQIGNKKFKSLIPASKALDLGCGIGRQVIVYHEFGIDGYGVDISENALKEAIVLGGEYGKNLTERLYKVTGEPVLPFDDDFFEVATCDSVLDSMEFSFAKKYIKELERTVSNYVYLNLISDETSGASGSVDELVEAAHEQGTIQSYYNAIKIHDLIEDTSFKVVQLHKVSNDDMLRNLTHTRFHVVLEKENK